MTAELTAVCDQQTAEGAGRLLSGSAASGARDGQIAVARQKAGGRLCAGRADLPGLCQRHRRCVRPQIPGLSPGGLGPHLTSSGFPPRAFLRFPVCPPGPSPSSAFFWFPFVRRSPVCSLRPLLGFRFPFGFPPGSLPLSNLHVSAAVRRFRRRWSRAAGTKVTSPAATTSPGPRDPPALQMGSGWARWDVATESPVTSGRERRTSPGPNRPERRFMCVMQFVRRRRGVTCGRPHCAAPAGGGYRPARRPGDRWFCPAAGICLPGSAGPGGHCVRPPDPARRAGPRRRHLRAGERACAAAPAGQRLPRRGVPAPGGGRAGLVRGQPVRPAGRGGTARAVPARVHVPRPAK